MMIFKSISISSNLFTLLVAVLRVLLLVVGFLLLGALLTAFLLLELLVDVALLMAALVLVADYSLQYRCTKFLPKALAKTMI